LLHRQASFQQRACFASSKVSRFVTPTVPPTGADVNEFYGVSAPNVVPFVVTNRTGKRNRAGRVPVVRSVIAACPVAGWWPSAKTLALKVTGLVCWSPARFLHEPIPSDKCNHDATPTLAITNHCRNRFQSQAHRKMTPATAVAGVLIWPKPPPSAVNVVLLRRLHIDSGGVSARLASRLWLW
jgi:hypothetical protein